MKNVYTVGQVNSYIRNMFTQDFALNRLYVKGEVSNCKYHSSGHIYFSLKDESGMISCVMFANQRAGLGFKMENGQTVVAFGSVNVYERDGTYQVYVKELTLDGAGALYQQYELLKQQLDEMGMFAQEYKQPIPRYVKKIGIVTAPTGAAIRDIMNVCRRRNPSVQLILYPALVQGDGAADSICRGLAVLDAAGVDVIIAGRGGGSMEDLWAFNEEVVARAIFNCATPVISAVGHETDVTIADYVADLRAPTPSAAAELATYELEEVLSALDNTQQFMQRQMRYRIDTMRERARQTGKKLGYLSPQNKIRERRQYAADLEEQLGRSMKQQLQQRRHRLELLASRMDGLSPLKKLQQGYSFVADSSGRAVTSYRQVHQADVLNIYVTDGRIEAAVKDIHADREQEEI